jgi:hypothetical protein
VRVLCEGDWPGVLLDGLVGSCGARNDVSAITLR